MCSVESYVVLDESPDPFVSGADGRFAVQLPVGRFSLFVREQSMFYANGWDGQGFIYPIDVAADTVTEVQFDITYLASF